MMMSRTHDSEQGTLCEQDCRCNHGKRNYEQRETKIEFQINICFEMQTASELWCGVWSENKENYNFPQRN